MKALTARLLAIGMASLTTCAIADSDIDLSKIRLPDGFRIEVYVEGVPDARSMALGANGTLFVASRRQGSVYAVPRPDGRPLEPIVLAQDLSIPNGVAYRDGDLYVAEVTRITRFRGIEDRLDDIPEPEVFNDDLPPETHHGWRYIDFGPDGKLYVSVGAPCNVCDMEGYGLIQRLSSDGKSTEVVAYGVRNSVGLNWHPETDELWFTDNGRDMLGNDLPAGELNRVEDEGAHFGFPYCHAGEVADPDFGAQRQCSEFVPPAQKLGPHVAPLGFLFYTGDMFPPEYRNQVLIAEHGSWNRTKKIGYRISKVGIDGSTATGYSVFTDGWLQDEKASGRPVDLLQLEDGSVLVSDDQSGAIYRISYTAP